MIILLRVGIQNSGKTILFECVEDGVTPEYIRCFAVGLNKMDWELRKELNNDQLWKNWMKARSKICYHFKTKRFGQGTVKPLMIISCEMRLNTEAERFCITGEDKKCGWFLQCVSNTWCYRSSYYCSAK